MIPYKILEARIEFDDNGQLKRITVLVEISQGDIRAMFATTQPRAGYMHLDPRDLVTEGGYNILQEVAATGMETIDRDKIFPNWKGIAVKG